MEVVFKEFGRVADHDSGVIDGGLMGEQMVEAVGGFDHRHEPVGTVEDLGGEVVGACFPAPGDESGDLKGEGPAFHRIRDFSLGSEFAIDVLVFPAEIENGAAPSGEWICSIPFAVAAGVAEAEAELGVLLEDGSPTIRVGKFSIAFAGLNFALAAVGEDGNLIVRAPPIQCVEAGIELLASDFDTVGSIAGAPLAVRLWDQCEGLAGDGVADGFVT